MMKKTACKLLFCDVVDSYMEQFLDKLNHPELLDKAKAVRLEFAKRTCGRPFHREHLAAAIVYCIIQKELPGIGLDWWWLDPGADPKNGHAGYSFCKSTRQKYARMLSDLGLVPEESRKPKIEIWKTISALLPTSSPGSTAEKLSSMVYFSVKQIEGTLKRHWHSGVVESVVSGTSTSYWLTDLVAKKIEADEWMKKRLEELTHKLH